MLKSAQELKKGREFKLKADQAFASQKWKKALQLYEDALRYLDEDARLYQRMGDIGRKMKENSIAVSNYKKAAQVYSHAGFWAKAIALNKIILEVDPEDTEVQRMLSKMYSTQNIKSQTDPGGSVNSPPVQRPEAISIAGAEPLEGDSGGTDSFIGNTVSIAGAAPLSFDSDEKAPSSQESHLGKPQTKGKSIPLLSDLSEPELSAFLERLAIRTFPTGSLVCEEGDAGQSMYIIAEGILEVHTKDPSGRRLKLTELSGGDFFGEFGLLTNGQRNASVEAKTDAEVLEITRADFNFIADRFPGIWVVLEEHLRRRMMDQILRKSPVFRFLSDEERSQLTQLVDLRKIDPEEIVMEEGTPGEEMFFIKSGTLGVTVKPGPERVAVGELTSGDYFGEVAMLSGRPRTATVRSLTACELFCLTRVDAAKVLKHNKQILLELKSRMDARAKETAEVAKSYEEARKTLDLV